MSKDKNNRDDDDRRHWDLAKPEHAPPHDRFFEDGEEPPERYDLPDRLDYIEANPEVLDPKRWYRVGRGFDLKTRRRIIYSHILPYYLLVAMSLAVCGACVPFLFTETILGDGIVRLMLEILTSDPKRFRSASDRHGWSPLYSTIANLPAFVTRVTAIFGVYLISMPIWVLGEAIIVTLVTPSRSKFAFSGSYWTAERPWLGVACVLGGIVLVAVHAFVVARVCGFATHLIVDYRLDPLQAIRANWRVTRGRTRLLIRVKLGLWLIKYVTGLLTCGIGLLIAEPYHVAVWTAAYLDIAGSEPPRDLTPAAVCPSSPGQAK